MTEARAGKGHSRLRLAGMSGGIAASFAFAEFADLQLLGKQVELSEALLAVSLVALVGGAVGLGLRLVASLLPRSAAAWHGSWLSACCVGVGVLLLGCVGAHAIAREVGDAISFGALVRWTALLSVLTAFLAASATLHWSTQWISSAERFGAASWAFALALSLAGIPGAVGVAVATFTFLFLAALGSRFPKWVAAASLAALAVECSLVWPRLSDAPATPSRAATGSAILIVLDTLRADALGAYGAGGNPTPVFDAMARRGVLFEQAIAPSSWTVPVHASLLTGLVPRVHGVGMHSMRRLDDSVVTLAEELSGRGYETVGFSGNSWLRVSNLFQGFSRSAITNFLPRDELGLTTLMRYTGVGLDRWIDKGGSETRTELTEWLGERDRDRPFFLFINLYEAHDRYAPPIRFREGGIREWVSGIRASRRFNYSEWHKGTARSPDEIRALRGLYAAEVRFQDEQLGEIIDLLGRNVDLRTTTVFLTADHGENLGDGGRWSHILDLNDVLIRVPLTVSGPGVLGHLERDHTLRSLIDVNQTLRRITGLASAGSGKDLFDGKPNPWPVVISEYVPDSSAMIKLRAKRESNPEAVDWPIRAVRGPEWKLMDWGSGRVGLFDVLRDRDEVEDLSSAHPEIVAAYRRELDSWLSSHVEKLPADPRRSNRPEIDEVERERLRALGYL